jgi:hypothetical protein
VKTAKHINIPGTRFFIVPPAGFEIAEDQPALVKGGSRGIVVMDLMGGNFYTNGATFNRKGFEAQGITVQDYQELKVDGFPAKMVAILSPEGMKGYNLIFGDTTFSVSVMVAFPRSDDATGEEIRRALQTIYYDKSWKVDPFAKAAFRLDDTHTRFKFAKFTANIYLYSLDGIKKESYEDEPMFMVSVVPAMGMMPEIIADESLNKIKEKTTRVIESGEGVMGKVHGYSSFRRSTYLEMKGKKTLFYQHIVIIGNTAVLMMGIANSNIENYLSDFQQLSNTITGK